MAIEERIPLLEEILEEWKEQIGKDYRAYRNHVYRVVHFCLALHDSDEEERERIVIAGGFHDLGIWTDDTLDYIPPSVVLAREYLERRDLAHWSAEIEPMIDLHHRIRKYEDRDHPLVEVFRRADLVDVSLGMVRWGLPKDYVREVRGAFPNSGFHKRLNQLAVGWFFKHPLNPLPFLKW